ncbi:superoxide dismutase [Fragilaria crotonensis]|nr:superoxide dismutase [Fragilaria crotonensis]
MNLSFAVVALSVCSSAAWTMSAGCLGNIRRHPAIANAYAVPDLPYPFEALEPYIDAPTMKLHHDKHHATYVANINKATEGKEQVDILELQANALEAGPAVRNNGGGHYNHAFFWDELIDAKTAATTKPSAQLEELIAKSSFGTIDELKAAFEAKAAPGATFGSGWVWLCVTNDNELKIVNTPNQDNPLMKGAVAEGVIYPILGLDVWEHAYYLKYQNRRPEYVSAWWNVVNWDKVSSNCAYVVEHHSGVKVQG